MVIQRPPLPERLATLRDRARREVRWATLITIVGGVIGGPLSLAIAGLIFTALGASGGSGPLSTMPVRLAGFAFAGLGVRLLLGAISARWIYAVHYYSNLWFLRTTTTAQLFVNEEYMRLMQQELTGNFILQYSYRYSYTTVEAQLEHCACMFDALWFAAKHQPTLVRHALQRGLNNVRNKGLFRVDGQLPYLLWAIGMLSLFFTYHTCLIGGLAGPWSIITNARLVAFLDEYLEKGSEIPPRLLERFATGQERLARMTRWQQWWAAHSAPWRTRLPAPP